MKRRTTAPGLFDQPEEAQAGALVGAEPIEPAPGNRWHLDDRTITPSQAADRYSRDVFGRSRELLAKGVIGSWEGYGFRGYFHFEDGRACYRIECKPGGHWIIYRE